MKRFICLHLIPANLFDNNAIEVRNIAIPVDRICEVSDYVDKTLYKGIIQSKILMNDGMVYYSVVPTQDICNILN